MVFLKLFTNYFVIPIGHKFEYGITALKTIKFCSCSLRFVIQSEATTVSSMAFLTAMTAAGWRTLQPSVWPLNSFSGISTQVTQTVTSAGSSFRFLTVYCLSLESHLFWETFYLLSFFCFWFSSLIIFFCSSSDVLQSPWANYDTCSLGYRPLMRWRRVTLIQ